MQILIKKKKKRLVKIKIQYINTNFVSKIEYKINILTIKNLRLLINHNKNKLKMSKFGNSDF